MFDIETLPNLCFTWGLGKQYVNYENIHKERKVACICYKWVGDPKIYSLTMDMAKHDLTKTDDTGDYEMLKKFSEVYAQADLAVGHNAIAFDKAFIRSRLVKHRLPDIAPVIIDDTYISATPLKFNSHKLDYLSRYLGLGTKAPHPYRLWVEVVQGSRPALRKMVKYCIQDIRLLERVYKALQPYVKTKLNRAVFAEDFRVCPSCGVAALVSSGTKRTAGLGLRHQYRCTACGKYCTTGKSLIKLPGNFPREVTNA